MHRSPNACGLQCFRAVGTVGFTHRYDPGVIEAVETVARGIAVRLPLETRRDAACDRQRSGADQSSMLAIQPTATGHRSPRSGIAGDRYAAQCSRLSLDPNLTQSDKSGAKDGVKSDGMKCRIDTASSPNSAATPIKERQFVNELN